MFIRWKFEQENVSNYSWHDGEKHGQIFYFKSGCKRKDYALLLCEIIQSKPYLATKEENRGGIINPESPLCPSFNIK